MNKHTVVDPNEGAFAGPSSAGYQTGVTKREYFAGLALQGVLASVTWEPDGRFTLNGMNTDTQFIAKETVALADALIAELNKEVENVG